MKPFGQAIGTIEGISPGDVISWAEQETAPAILRGLVEDWPLVRAARESREAVDGLLRDSYEGAPVTAFYGREPSAGRIFYNTGLAGLNFEQVRVQLTDVLSRLADTRNDSNAPVTYMGSMATKHCLPGLAETHQVPFEERDVTTRIWLGNRTRVAAHYDAFHNIACVCAGRRRFTLFPPDQLGNLYIGPVDLTPAGQAISLVDFESPDFDRFPRFAEAMEHAQYAELEPGDAIYVPAMWWHHVEGLADFNILINNWWRSAPAYMGPPLDALFHALLNIRGLSRDERRAWKALFDYYVFSTGNEHLDHIPAEHHGILGDLDEDKARQLRAVLRNHLNR